MKPQTCHPELVEGLHATSKAQKNRRRYYLHYRIRKTGVKVYANLHTVALPATEKPTPHMIELRDRFNYNIQLTLV